MEAVITVKKYPVNEYANVFHFTQYGNKQSYGDRIPAVWINNKGYFHICSAVNKEPNHCYDIPFDLGKTYHLKIHQFNTTGT